MNGLSIVAPCNACTRSAIQLRGVIAFPRHLLPCHYQTIPPLMSQVYSYLYFLIVVIGLGGKRGKRGLDKFSAFRRNRGVWHLGRSECGHSTLHQKKVQSDQNQQESVHAQDHWRGKHWDEPS